MRGQFIIVAMRNVYSPSELNREAKIHLEAGFGTVWLEGEISNLARPASGHLYFSLKDAKAQIRCALFRSSAKNVKFQPANGQQVQVRGRLSLYEPRGDYQLIADSMESAGEGKLRAAFDALKRQLDKEGLFDPSRKQPLPVSPRKIAVITSPSGAVIRDILHVLQRRWPMCSVRLYPVPVQGETAAPAIVKALQAVDRHGWGEAVILARGGGSLEDLWAFNEESVARAIAAAITPVVSAVGHETDISISDFVADLRAPTPSAAAEILSLDSQTIQQAFAQFNERLTQRMLRRLQEAAQHTDGLTARLHAQHPRRRIQLQSDRLSSLRSRLIGASQRDLVIRQQQLAQLDARQRAAIRQVVPRQQQQLSSLARTLHAVSPLPTLQRGYSATTDGLTGSVITSCRQVEPGQIIRTRVADGLFDSTITNVSADKNAANDEP